jgi:hypothetical protein
MRLTAAAIADPDVLGLAELLLPGSRALAKLTDPKRTCDAMSMGTFLIGALSLCCLLPADHILRSILHTAHEVRALV